MDSARVLGVFADDFEGDAIFEAGPGPIEHAGPVTITGRGPARLSRAGLVEAVDRFLASVDVVTQFALSAKDAKQEGDSVRGLVACSIQARKGGGTLCIQERLWFLFRKGKVVSAARLEGGRKLETTGRTFVEATDSLGLTAPANIPCHDCNYNGVSTHICGGVALGDMNGDGLLDIFVAGSARSHLFLNRGDHCEDVTEKAGLAEAAGNGAIWLDYDGDGWLDLLVTRMCHPDSKHAKCSPTRSGWCGGKGCAVQLYRNKGDGTFENVTERAGLRCTGIAMSACAADVDGDGNLDVYVCRYGYLTPTTYDPEVYDVPWVQPDPPYNAKNAPPHLLFHNNGDGTFSEIGEKAGVADRGWGLACCFVHAFGSAGPDLFVVNDMGRNILYRNKGDGTFEDATARSMPDDYGFGMGVARADFGGDGKSDLYVSKMFSSAGGRVIDSMEKKGRALELARLMRKFAEGSTLFRSKGDGTFADVSKGSGTTNAGWAFGTVACDYDNDGLPDIYVANGYVSSETQREM
ncbi:VCBS repeat-containing protein [bacterium]|nr:VCBS repeat-containing protein [bacterium]